MGANNIFIKYIQERWIDMDIKNIDESDSTEYALWLCENRRDTWEKLIPALDYSKICESIHSNDYEKLCQIDKLEKYYLHIMKDHLIGTIEMVHFLEALNDDENDFDQSEETKAEIISHNKERLME